MPAPSISLIVSTYNHPAALEEILQRLAAGTELPRQVLIADDGSGAETRKLIERWVEKGTLNLLHCWHEDQGFRKSRVLNMALARSEAEYVVFLDGDCLPDRRFVADHRRLARQGFFTQGRRAFVAEDRVAALLGGEVSLGALAMRGGISGLPKAVRHVLPIIRTNQGLRGLLGCNLGMSKKDLIAVNGFDEAYEGWGKEDSDLCVRLYNLGLSRRFVYGRALVFHLNHPIADRGRLDENERLLRETIESGKTRCERGMDQYTDLEAAS